MNERILIVFAEEHIRLLYSEELSDVGYETVSHDRGADLVDKIETFQPDVLILGARLDDQLETDKYSLDLITQLRMIFYELLIVYSTSLTEYWHQAEWRGADGFDTKGFDLSTLKATIKKLLSERL